MKRVMLLAVVFVLLSGMAFAELKNEVKKFKTTFIITYNAISLEDAAKVEKQIRKQHKSAGSLMVTVRDDDSLPYFYNNTEGGVVFENGR